MTAQVLKNVRLFAGGYDLTGNSNKVEIKKVVESKVATTFGSYDAASGQVWEEVVGGMAKAAMAAGGPDAFGVGLTDEVVSDGLGVLNVWSACPFTANVGSVAHLAYAMEGDVTNLGQLGEVAPWAAAWTSSAPMARGVVLHPPATARTATGNGTAVQNVAVGANQRLYAALHVLSVAGTSTPTVTVKVQTDDNSGFTSPTDRITFTGATAVGGQWGSAAGAITDDYLRCVWTISGSSPSFLFLVTAGVV